MLILKGLTVIFIALFAKARKRAKSNLNCRNSKQMKRVQHAPWRNEVHDVMN